MHNYLKSEYQILLFLIFYEIFDKNVFYVGVKLITVELFVVRNYCDI